MRFLRNLGAQATLFWGLLLPCAARKDGWRATRRSRRRWIRIKDEDYPCRATGFAYTRWAGSEVGDYWMDTAYLATTILLAAMAAVRAGILLLKPTFTGHQR